MLNTCTCTAYSSVFPTGLQFEVLAVRPDLSLKGLRFLTFLCSFLWFGLRKEEKISRIITIVVSLKSFRYNIEETLYGV